MRSRHAVLATALCSLVLSSCGFKKYRGDSAPLPPGQQEQEQDQKLANFTKFCVSPESAEVARTIDAIKTLAETTECGEAQKFLSAQKSLDLQGVSITDLRPLADLDGLQQLSLRANGLQSLEGLNGLTSLETLDVSRNSLPSGVDFKQFPALKNLAIEDSGVTSTGWLAPTCDLTSLLLNDNALEDFTGIAGCTKLETLGLSRTAMADGDAGSAGIAGLSALKALHLDGNQLTNVGFAPSLAKLEELKASGNSITSIEQLRTMMALKVVEMNANKIGSLEPLKPLPNLTAISFSANPVMKWSKSYPVDCPTKDTASQTLSDYCASYLQKHHTFLWHCLYITDANDPRRHVVERIMTKIRVPIDECQRGYEKLESKPKSMQRNLNLSKTQGKPQLKDLAPLHDRVFAFVERLSLDNNLIKDLRPIALWSGLEYLSASNGPVKVMPPLRRFGKLEQLRLADTELKNLSFVRNAADHPLRTLFINGTELTSYNGLETLSNLRNLQLGPSPKVADLGVVSNITSLWSLNILGNKQFTNLYISAYPDLEYLGVVNQSEDPSFLTNLSLPTKLKHLDARYNVETTQALNALPMFSPRLESLNLFGNTGITTLAGLKNLPANRWDNLELFCASPIALSKATCPNSKVPSGVANFCNGKATDLPGCRAGKFDGMSPYEIYLEEQSAQL